MPQRSVLDSTPLPAEERSKQGGTITRAAGFPPAAGRGTALSESLQRKKRTGFTKSSSIDTRTRSQRGGATTSTDQNYRGLCCSNHGVRLRKTFPPTTGDEWESRRAAHRMHRQGISRGFGGGSRLSTDLFASSGFAPEASRSKRHLGQTLNSGRAGGSIDVSAYAVPYPYTPMYQDYATVPTAGRFPGTIPLPPGHYAGGTYAGMPNMYHWPYAEYDRRPGHVDFHPRSAAVPLGYIPAGAYANGSGYHGAPSTELDNHAYGYSNGACAPLLLHPAEGRAIVSAFPGRGWYHPASPPSPSPPPPQSLQRLPEAISLATLPPRPGTPSKETTGELSRACGYSEVEKYQNNHPNHSLALKQQRVLWTHEEDQQLTELVHHFGPQRWQAMASQFMPHRAGAQLRSRWIYVLDQRDRRRPFSEEEDRLILQLYEEHGRRWSWISRHLNDRTDQEVKNRCHQLSRVRAETEGGSEGKGTESVSDRSARSPKSETVGRLPCPNSNVSALTQLDSRKALHGAAGQSERKEEQPRSSRANSVENSSGHHDATT